MNTKEKSVCRHVIFCLFVFQDMPLSGKEKQRRFREKKKQEGTYDEYKAKDNKRKKDKRKSLSHADLKKLQRAERDYQRKRRQESRNAQQATDTPESLGTYKTRQSLGKAVKRVSI